MDAAEYERRHQRLAVLAEFFRSHEAKWIEARELESVAGRCAWRSRVSECRTKLGMTIENKQTRIAVDSDERTGDSGFAVLSQYRYLSHQPLGRDASTAVPTFQRELFQR